MDITTICKVILCIGILQTCSLDNVAAVDGIHFKVPEIVEWSDAEPTCQKNNGTLFKPNETSFDVSLFSDCNFKDDLWVAAKYINITNVGSASRGDSFIRCEMCKIEASCGVTCLYKACGERCKVLCVGLDEPYNPLLSARPNNWTEANQWCSEYRSKVDDKIQNTSFILPVGYCIDGCFWTRNMIQVQLESEIAHGNKPGKCGILHNGTLSFTSCKRQLQPLCERDDIEKRTTIGLNEKNPSLLVPVGVTQSKNDLEDSPKKSDTGIIIIIGAVVGSVVFLMLTVLTIICVRRKLLQRTFRSKHASKNLNMLKTDTTHKGINHYQSQDVPIESESGLTPFAQLESKCEGSRSDIVGPKSNPGKPAFTIDPERSNFNYAKVAKKMNVNSSNLTYKINDDTYDHLNDIRQSRYDNEARNLYDTTNFDQRNDSTYDISGGHSKTPDEGVGLYDRVNATVCSEYDTTDDLRRDSNSAYDHI